MIQIGINPNVFIESVQLDDKNALEIKFNQGETKKKLSLFENIAQDEVVENTGMSVKLFAPLPPKKEDMTEEKKVDLVLSDLNGTKGVLRHLLLGYYTKEDLNGMWAHVYDGLPITEENMAKQILVKEILEAIHKNMARVFIDKMKPFFNDGSKLFRLLLVRQSKDKHYATFRKRYIQENPFWESMEIPDNASKVKFTDYEKREGLDNGLPVSKEAGDPKTSSPTATAATMTASNVFGQ